MVRPSVSFCRKAFSPESVPTHPLQATANLLTQLVQAPTARSSHGLQPATTSPTPGFDSINLVRPGANNPGTTLVTKDGTQLFLGLDWFPDGRTLVFGVTGGSFGQENSNLYLYDIPDDELDAAHQLLVGICRQPQRVARRTVSLCFEYAPTSTVPPNCASFDAMEPGCNRWASQGTQPDWKPGSGLQHNSPGLSCR